MGKVAACAQLQERIGLRATGRAVSAALAACLLIASCATPVVPMPIGGSKADGVVILGANYGMWQSPDYKWDEALASARRTCIGWGYKDAQPFNQFQTRCTDMTPAGCAHTEVVMRFQCTDTFSPRSSLLPSSGGGAIQCQVDADCSAGQSCRSRKGGGTECRASTAP